VLTSSPFFFRFFFSEDLGVVMDSIAIGVAGADLFLPPLLGEGDGVEAFLDDFAGRGERFSGAFSSVTSVCCFVS
jgi:hypothetical protein